MLLIAAMLLPGCATFRPAKTTGIGPYTEFNGRLLVIEPARRWQVSVSWRANTPGQGWLRLTHAATARIVELQWQGHSMRMRDNQSAALDWQNITQTELASQGIILPPQTLAAILLGQIPKAFTQEQEGRWAGRHADSFIRLEWQPQSQRLTMTDVTHGRKAILLIDRGQ